jgi:hypothetical protein
MYKDARHSKEVDFKCTQLEGTFVLRALVLELRGQCKYFQLRDARRSEVERTFLIRKSGRSVWHFSSLMTLYYQREHELSLPPRIPLTSLRN